MSAKGYCHDCDPGKKFHDIENGKSDWRKHVRKSDHKKKLDLKCPNCRKEFSGQRDFKSHICFKIQADASFTKYTIRNEDSAVNKICKKLTIYDKYLLLQEERISIQKVSFTFRLW